MSNLWGPRQNTGFPLSEYIERGVTYYLVTLDWDFAVIGIIVLVMLLFLFLILNRKYCSIFSIYPFVGLGIIIYMCYIIYIGGDFMKGRHFTVIFWVSLVSLSFLLCDLSKVEDKNRNALCGIILLGMFVPILINCGVIMNPIYKYAQNPKWIYTDERNEYFQYTGLPNVLREGKGLIWECQHRGIQWYRGVEWYEERLYDPLLSRLPALEKNNTWIVGHMERKFPDGYRETLVSGENCIVNNSLHEYYDVVYEIVSGELFSFERVKKIIKLNMGEYNYLLDEYVQSNY